MPGKHVAHPDQSEESIIISVAFPQANFKSITSQIFRVDHASITEEGGEYDADRSVSRSILRDIFKFTCKNFRVAV